MHKTIRYILLVVGMGCWFPPIRAASHSAHLFSYFKGKGEGGAFTDGVRQGTAFSISGDGFAALRRNIDSAAALPITSWRFKTGFDRNWIISGFDDSDWAAIETGKAWEAQGYNEYDGDACYRASLTIPSTMLVEKQGGLRFELGGIDDKDSVFLNGHFIGSTEIFTKDRIYYLHNEQGIIRWDDENTLAIKVTDKTGWGGMYRGIPAVAIAKREEFIEIATVVNQWDYPEASTFHKTIQLRSKGGAAFSGTLSMQLHDNETGLQTSLQAISVSFAPGSPETIPVQVTLPRMASYRLHYHFLDVDGLSEAQAIEPIPYLLTPAAVAAPRINGPDAYGIRPGTPLNYRIPISGEKPVSIKVKGLPKGVSIDRERGVLYGQVDRAGRYPVLLTVTNRHSSFQRTLTIEVGDRLALTPPMGWNSWNAWGTSVSDIRIREAAYAMDTTGLADFGWRFINIDDGWQGSRDRLGHIQGNDKFPDMPGLTRYIHQFGLLAGIYSSPGPRTCGLYPGSHGHEAEDANQWIAWGFDLLKYDLCSYQDMLPSHALHHLQAPYLQMDTLLKALPRSMVMSLCQYGYGDVWKWGASVGGSLWRTGEDITDTWASIKHLGFSQHERAAYAGPGQWNDPDMLVVGELGWGTPRPTQLTPDEQYTQISLWCMQASPLFLGCDLTKLDPFSKNLLCNAEVLAINQDVLGKQAIRIDSTAHREIYLKPLVDGDVALAIFNLGEQPLREKIDLADFALVRAQTIRDVWRQQEVEHQDLRLDIAIPAHGVLMYRLGN